MYSSFDSLFSYRFPIKVGIKDKQPKTNKVINALGLTPILSIYFKVNPVWMRIKLFGIRPTNINEYIPKNEAMMKYLYGIPTKGEPRFTNQLGIKGVNLKKSMYQKRFYLFEFTIPWNFWNKDGNFLKTSYLARVKLKKKQRLAPKQEH